METTIEGGNIDGNEKRDEISVEEEQRLHK